MENTTRDVWLRRRGLETDDDDSRMSFCARSIGMTYYSRDFENPADIHGGTSLSTIFGVVTGLTVARPRTRARRGYRLVFKRWVSNFSRKIANAINRKTHSNNAIDVAKNSCL